MQLMMLTTRSRSVQQIHENRAAHLAEHHADMRRTVEPHNPFCDVLADGAWRDEPCFIIGGGPSLIGFDFERLRGRGHIIAINRAFEFVPFADILFFMDRRFYQICHDDPARYQLWQDFKGYKVFLNIMGRKFDDCNSVRSVGRNGASTSIRGGLHHGNNSGVGALNLALCLKAKPIYLLGYDMRHENGQAHFHTGYGGERREKTVLSFAREFEHIGKSLTDKSGIVNLNPRSMLKLFPFGNIDEVLKDGKTRQSVGHDRPALCDPVSPSASA
jgi:hypothetical protein